jgi:hypothetical protein
VAGLIIAGCSQNPAAPDKIQLVNGKHDILLAHHSVGSQMMPYLRPLLNAYNSQHETDINLWDENGYQITNGNHFYNGYAFPGGPTGSDFPQGYAAVFGQPLDDDGIMENTFERILLPHVFTNSRYNWIDSLNHEWIIIKTCFVANRYYLESWVARDSLYYLAIRDDMDQHPEKRFTLMTSPPLVRAVGGNPQQAEILRARCFRIANFLKSEAFTSGHNIEVFDLYGLLMESAPSSNYYGYLKVAYGGATGDSHPNGLGRQAFAEALMAYLENGLSE